MERWRLAVCDPGKNEGARLYLMNRSETIITVNRRIKFDPLDLFRDLERIGFPLKYTNGLERIHLTVLKKAGGWYSDGIVWVDVGKSMIEYALETFIHEVGHHVDEQENVSPILHEERLKRVKHLGEPLSRKRDDEYFAVGFQKFYSEDPAHRRRLCEKNPMLYRAIRKLHSEYRWKG